MFSIIRKRTQSSSLKALEQFYNGSIVELKDNNAQILSKPLEWTSHASIIDKIKTITDSTLEEFHFPTTNETTILIQNDRSSRERGAIATSLLQEMKNVFLKPIVDGLSDENEWIIINQNLTSIHLCTSKTIEDNNLRNIFTYKEQSLSKEEFFKQFISALPKSILKKPTNHPGRC